MKDFAKINIYIILFDIHNSYFKESYILPIECLQYQTGQVIWPWNIQSEV